MVWSTPADPEELTIDFPGAGKWYFGTDLPTELTAPTIPYVAAEIIWVTDGYIPNTVAYLYRGYRRASINTLSVETGFVWVNGTGTPAYVVTDTSWPRIDGTSTRVIKATNISLQTSTEVSTSVIDAVKIKLQSIEPSPAIIGGTVSIKGDAVYVNGMAALVSTVIKNVNPTVDVDQVNYDVWIQGIVTDIKLGGVSGVQLDWAYKFTYDRIVDLRVMFTFPSAPASQQLVYAMPAAIPRPNNIGGLVNIELSYPALNAAAHTAGNRVPIGCRWATTGNLIFHGPSSGGTATIIKATGTYAVSKY